MMVNHLIKLIVIACTLVSSVAIAADKTQPTPKQILFKNVNVFNGTDNKLYKNHSVLVEGNKIQAISEKSIKANSNATVIDGKGKTLMPGLIDNHVHLNITGIPGVSSYEDMQSISWEKIGAQAAANARDYFMDGFTTVRDTCGMANGLREIINAGNIDGPRIYISAACISPTSGHGEARSPGQRAQGAESSWLQKLGIIQIADGPDEIRKAARTNFSNGADFLKLMAGGGISSSIDPLWSHAYNQNELEAAVEAAEFFDTYVMVHAYTDRSVKSAIDAGVKVIDHGHMVSEETVKLIVEKNIFWSINTSSLSPELALHPNFAPGTPSGEKLISFHEGSKNLWKHIKKHKPKILFNVDTVLSPMGLARAHRDHEMWMMSKNLGNIVTLRAMTSTAGELAQLTKRRNPYPGKLGVVEKDAYADLILVDGNPLEDLSVLGANEKFFAAANPPREQGRVSIKIIMKDGKIYKNTL